MSKTLIYTLACLTLTGCIGGKTVQVVDQTSPVEVIAYSALQGWMNLQEQSAKLTPEQAASELSALGEPEDADAFFHLGLLEQQLKTFNGWTQARDIFRELKTNESLTGEQRQLVSTLEIYNQSRINWSELYNELLTDYKSLQEQLLASAEEKALLENKIKELTDIETVISTRKEQ